MWSKWFDQYFTQPFSYRYQLFGLPSRWRILWSTTHPPWKRATRSFSRAVAICHHQHPPTSVMYIIIYIFSAKTCTIFCTGSAAAQKLPTRYRSILIPVPLLNLSSTSLLALLNWKFGNLRNHGWDFLLKPDSWPFLWLNYKGKPCEQYYNLFFIWSGPIIPVSASALWWYDP